MNEYITFEEYQNEEPIVEGTEDEKDYEDMQVIDLSKVMADEEKMREKYRSISHRYHELIPHMTKLLKTKEPAGSLKYLVLSNLLTVAFLFRLHNGEVLDPATLPDIVTILLK